MGDIVYPGIVLTRVLKTVTEEDVQKYVNRVLGIDARRLRDGKAKVEIFRRDWNATVVISGIMIELDQIKNIIGFRRLLGRFVFVESVDFGVQRNCYGLMDHHHYQLHKKMKEGQGILRPLPVFLEDFEERFGSIEDLGYSIFFDDVKENLRDKLFYKNADILLFGNVPKKAKSGVVFGNVQMENENMEIILRSRMDALQRICIWNKNTSFSGEKKSFVTGKEGFLCQLSRNCGIGVHGSFLDVRALLKKEAFIPKSALNMRIFSKEKLDALAIKCAECSESYNILGIDKDISWLAARCGCQNIGPGYTWFDENFYRITIPNAKRKLTKDDDNDNPTAYDKVVRLIPGLKPMYESLTEFRDVAYGAYCSEFRFNKRIMKSQQTTGVLTETNFIEYLNPLDEDQEIWAYHFTVEETKLWSSKGQHGIKYVTIVPQNPSTDACSLSADITCTSFKNNLWIKSTRYKISSIPDSQNVRVTLIVTVDALRKLKVGDKAILIPKPSDDEKKVIAATIKKWEAFLYRRNKPKILSIVDSSEIAKQTIWTSGLEIFNVWYVKLHLEKIPILDKLALCLEDCYIGIKTNIVGLQDVCTGRVVGIETNHKGGHTLQVVFVLQQNAELCPGNKLFLYFWMIARNAKVLVNRDNVPQVVEADVIKDLKYYNVHHEWVDEIEAYDETRRNIMASCADPFDLINLIEIYEEKSLPEQRTCNLDWLLRKWRDEPTQDLHLFDYLLYPSSSRKQDNVIHHDPSYYEDNKEKIDVIRNNLNDSQVSAIDLMLCTEICTCQGPPGTGKTKTMAHGTLDLNCREGGLIMACCPSNYAANVFYEELVLAKTKCNIGINITRMYSDSRERELASLISDIMDEDHNLLHIAVQQHPFWRNDDGINEIIDKVQQGQGALLKRDEKKQLRQHTLAITRIILTSTDVVICTVGAASDSRIDTCLTYCRRFAKELTGLFVDEASLLSVPSTIPLLAFNPRRLWLVGDDCQLRPTVTDETSKFACLDVSWMEFLRLTSYFKQGNMSVMLNVQYRMAAPIADLVSSFMYYGRVRSSESVKARNYADHGKLRMMPELDGKNIACYTYDGYGEQRPKNSWSFTNDKEVAVTRRILLSLHEQGIDFSKVVIISMYDAHVSFLRKMVTDLGEMFNATDVATVDSYQGKENEIIILNTVRSNVEHNVGFLREKRRLNVAISRSIDYLLIVADIRTLNKSELPDLTTLMELLAKKQITVNKYRCSTEETALDSSSTLEEYLKKC